MIPILIAVSRSDWVFVCNTRFYWCWNANSGDTGGLVQDDWHTLQWRKLAFLTTLGLRPWFMDWVGPQRRLGCCHSATSTFILNRMKPLTSLSHSRNVAIDTLLAFAQPS